MVVIIMGVSGAGKTTLGLALAQALDFAFAEGDTYHSPANIAKMSAGQPLTDADRLPWLRAMAADIARWVRSGRDVVLACSALKRRYRDILRGNTGQQVRLVYLCGTPELIEQRLRQRRGHFMPEGLLSSQFGALEEPLPDEQALTVDIAEPTDALVTNLCSWLK